MKYQLTSFELVKEVVALQDDPTLPWTAFDCISWPRLRLPKGYGIIYDPVLRKQYLAHRCAYRLKFGIEPIGVLHHCDNPACFRPSHLFHGDQKANMIDCKSKGRTTAGSRHPQAKLSEKAVICIRDMHQNGMASKQIAESFHVTIRNINRIIKRKIWTHI